MDLSTLPKTEGNREKRAVENTILTQLAKNFPVANGKSWTWNIASPWHDGSNFNAVDLNFGSGFEDRGQEIRSPEAGNVVYVSPEYGTLEILHTSNGMQWKSSILHMPIQKFKDDSGAIVEHKFTVQQITERFINGVSGASELVYGNIRVVFEQNGTIYRSWVEQQGDDKQWKMMGKVRDSLSTKDLVGFVGNQGASGLIEATSTKTFSPHLHYKAVDVVFGESVDLRNLLMNSTFGFGITTVHAEDSGVDGRLDLWGDNQSMLVHWDDMLHAFATSADQNGNAKNNPNLVLDRSPQNKDVSAADADQYWLAQEGTDVSTMKRVVWVNIGTPNQPIQRWITSTPLEAEKDVWNPITKKWATRAESLLW